MIMLRILCFLFCNCVCVMSRLDDGWPFYSKPVAKERVLHPYNVPLRDRQSSYPRERLAGFPGKRLPQRPIGVRFEKLGSHVLQNVGNTDTTINIEFGKSPRKELDALDKLVSPPKSTGRKHSKKAKRGFQNWSAEPIIDSQVGDLKNTADEPQNSQLETKSNSGQPQYSRDDELRLLDALMERHLAKIFSKTSWDGLEPRADNLQEYEATTEDPLYSWKVPSPGFELVNEVLYQSEASGEGNEADVNSEVEVGKMLSNDPQLSSTYPLKAFHSGEIDDKDDIPVMLAVDSNQELSELENTQRKEDLVNKKTEMIDRSRPKRSPSWYRPNKPAEFHYNTKPFHYQKKGKISDWKLRKWKAKNMDWKRSNDNVMDSYEDWKKTGVDWRSAKHGHGQEHHERQWATSNDWEKAGFDSLPSNGGWMRPADDWLNNRHFWKVGGAEAPEKQGHSHWKSDEVSLYPQKFFYHPHTKGKYQFPKHDTRMDRNYHIHKMSSKPAFRELHGNWHSSRRYNNYIPHNNHLGQINNFHPHQMTQQKDSWPAFDHFSYHKKVGFKSRPHTHYPTGYKTHDVHNMYSLDSNLLHGHQLHSNEDKGYQRQNEITAKEAPAMLQHRRHIPHHSTQGTHGPYWNKNLMESSHNRHGSKHEERPIYNGFQQARRQYDVLPVASYQPIPTASHHQETRSQPEEKLYSNGPPQPIYNNEYSNWPSQPIYNNEYSNGPSQPLYNNDQGRHYTSWG